MKKVFVLFATVAVAAMAISCGNKAEQSGQEQEQGGNKVEALEFFIDGDFSDWDALTADKADANNVIGEPTGDAKALKCLKYSSDKESIYVYAEVAIDKVQVSETAIEGGNSNDGHGDSTPGPLTFYWDLDGNPETGFLSHVNGDGDPYVAGLGCEVGTEMYLFVDSKDGLCKLGWAQVVYEPDGAEDGDVYQCGAWWSLDNPAGGWAPDYDNITPRLENYKTKIEKGVLRLEFSIERATLAQFTKRGHDMGDNIIVGATYNNGDAIAAFSYGQGVVGPLAVTLK